MCLLVFVRSDLYLRLEASREEMANSDSDVEAERGPFFSFLSVLGSQRNNRVSEWAAGSSWGINAIKGCL